MRKTMTKIARMLPGLLGLAFLLLTSVSGRAAADTGGDRKTVDNVAIYLGLVPSEIIRGHPAQHPEAAMHGGQPEGSNEYHVVIALFDAKSGSRITKADVTARVSEVGLAGTEKKLQPMEIAGFQTYGNYFRMTGNGPFRISLIIRIPGEVREIKAEFEHSHW